MPAPLPQTPQERAQQLSFLQNLLGGEPGILRKMFIYPAMRMGQRFDAAAHGQFLPPEDIGPTVLDTAAFVSPGAIGTPRGALGVLGSKPFYSKLAETVEASPQAKASGQQWINTLTNAGVKPEELQYSGFAKQFADQPSVTKQQASSFLADNGVRVGETIKGGQPIEVGQHSDGSPIYGRELGPTKFSQYQMPGGENYKELLLTLPPPAWHYPGRADAPSAAAEAKVFRSSHFDEPNVLAHIRMNDRVDANGKKTLFLEEVQSDWHQKGREQGYGPQTETNYQTYYQTKDGQKIPVGYGKTAEESLANSGDWRNQQVELKTEPYTHIVGQGVPDAPFKKDWPDLAMKRAIKYAADNGYDQVAWTPGHVQADRYDLSKHVDQLSYDAENQRLSAWKDGKVVLGETDVTPDKLADYVGKEMAEKIQKHQDSTGSDMTHFKGLDLKVGGEGMHGFYDKILPSVANKIGKRFGAKVGTARISTMPGYSGMKPEVAAAMAKTGEGHEVMAIPITPAMREEVGKKGLPLFTGGVPLGQTPHQDRARMLQSLPAIMGNRS